MKRQTIKANYIETIDWLGGNIVDWVCGGQLYSAEGENSQIATYHYNFNFNGCITSQHREYVFVYERLGTKGLLLKNGELLREVNRSYYHANDYEYPAAFITRDNKTYLIHCPQSYCQIDFEDVETGELVTNISERRPSDVFHSRLSISPDGKYLMVCGWLLHPLDIVELFNVEECLKNPLLLDKSLLCPEFGTEISSASFIDNDRVLIASSDEEPFDDEVLPILPQKHIAIWNFKTNELSEPVQVNAEIGNLFAINDKQAWDTFKFPKLINLETGEVQIKFEEVFSGLQCSSIYYDIEKNPQICFDKNSGKIAIKTDNETVEVFSYSL